MEKQKISSQDLTKLQRKNFCLLKKTFDITTKTIPLFKKYAPKYARKVKIIRNDCPKTTNPRLKYLNSFGFYRYSSSFGPIRLKESQIFRIIKNHKKYIKYGGGIHITPQLIKELPQLHNHMFYYYGHESEEKYRIMTFCRALERLSFNLKYGCSSSAVQSISQTLEKKRYRILRALRAMRFMKELSLRFQNECLVSLFSFLQVFGSCPLFLSYLEFFSIDMYSCSQENLPENFMNDANVKMALRYVTHLEISDNILFEKFVSDYEMLKNLRSLVTRIKAKSTCKEETIRKLSMFKLLPKLKDLDLAFNSYSKRMEKAFLESFSLPKDIETVMLRLTDFVWKDLSLKLTKENRRIIEERFEKHPRFQRFYNKWKSLNNLQKLRLIIDNGYEDRNCPTLNLKFGMGIFTQMKNLKSLQYENEEKIWNKERLTYKILPMDLGIFWESLKGSKNTLENLEIKVSEMNFFGKKDLEEDYIGGFSRLKYVEILGQIYWARNLGDFLNIIAKKSKEEKVSVNVQDLCFKEEKYLKDFFENLQKIPKNLEVELGLDVCELNCSKWLESFCRFVARLKVEGMLKFKIKNARIETIQEVERIQQRVLENPVLEELIVQGERSKNFCVIRRCELVSGVDPWLINNGHVKAFH